MTDPLRPAFRPLEVCGLELEYAVVDRDLDVSHRVPDLLARLPEDGRVGFSNEIFDHVLEIRNPAPLRSLVDAGERLADGVRLATTVLAEEFGEMLLPTGMHPWFDPVDARLWSGPGEEIYRTYERIFDTRTHGWANVQACHVNVSFGSDADAPVVMNAAALLIPYLPALAASSPIVGGRVQEDVDTRLAFLVGHQARIPETMGEFVPEHVEDLDDFRERILEPMYAALDRFPGCAAIRHEFLNARAAVPRMSRRALEVRVLDVQECVRMDVAIAVFVRAVVAALRRGVLEGRITPPAHRVLVSDFREVVRRGGGARVEAPHLVADGPVPVALVLARLMGLARAHVAKDEASHLDLLEPVIVHGSLSERIVARLGGEPGIRGIYRELADCLARNEPWPGRCPGATGAPAPARS